MLKNTSTIHNKTSCTNEWKWVIRYQTLKSPIANVRLPFHLILIICSVRIVYKVVFIGLYYKLFNLYIRWTVVVPALCFIWLHVCFQSLFPHIIFFLERVKNTVKVWGGIYEDFMVFLIFLLYLDACLVPNFLRFTISQWNRLQSLLCVWARSESACQHPCSGQFHGCSFSQERCSSSGFPHQSWILPSEH